ncbi:MAG: SGNH/GDSL hydrolase family protein, partial [Gordonia sp. (in: high G+C Gram-positive bacteria)]
MTKKLRPSRPAVRSTLLGLVVGGMLLAGPGTAAAEPTSTIDVPSLGNSSSDLDLIDTLTKMLGRPDAPAGDGKSRCGSVIQIGDSTSVAADSTASLPSADDTATVQFRRVGAAQVTVDALSGRAVVGGPG